MTKTGAELERRDEHMANAAHAMRQVCAEAELRGMDPLFVASAVAEALAARNPTLAGKVIGGVAMAVRAQPVTKVVLS